MSWLNLVDAAVSFRIGYATASFKLPAGVYLSRASCGPGHCRDLGRLVVPYAFQFERAIQGVEMREQPFDGEWNVANFSADFW